MQPKTENGKNAIDFCTEIEPFAVFLQRDEKNIEKWRDLLYNYTVKELLAAGMLPCREMRL